MIDMLNTLPRHEEIERAQRLEYGAVPLDPNHAWDHKDDTRPYTIASYERITERLTRAMLGAIDAGWVESDELMLHYYEMLEVSLYDSQACRIVENARPLPEEALLDPRMPYAKNGYLAPADLLGLLIAHPGLTSVELAKLSHPLEPLATFPMDKAVAEAIVHHGGRVLFESPIYKPKTFAPELPAMTVLRKQVIGEYTSLSDERIQIVARKAFLVRGDEEACEDAGRYFDRKVRHGAEFDTRGAVQTGPRFDELKEHLEGELPQLATHPHLRWLQPIATSYYAKYIK